MWLIVEILNVPGPTKSNTYNSSIGCIATLAMATATANVAYKLLHMLYKLKIVTQQWVTIANNIHG